MFRSTPKPTPTPTPSRVFNLTLQQIITIVLTEQPKNRVVKDLQNDVRIALSFDKDSVFNMFKPYVDLWRPQIMVGDVEYFLNIDASQQTNEKKYLERIDQLKKTWRSLSDDNRETIKEKVANLYVLF